MTIPQSFIQELLARVDIVEVVGRHVALKKGGANLLGLCPFHEEKTPSFSVSPSKQFFHCFGCGKNGNALGFLMEHTGVGFVEAVQDLAQQAGLSVPQDQESAEQRAHAAVQRQQRSSLSGLLEKAALAYQEQLKRSPAAVDYLKRRGLSGQVAKQYGIGYAAQQWRFLSTVLADYQDPLLVEAGLVIAADAAADAVAPVAAASSGQRGGKRYDRFRDRIMFPIRNVKGQCIGFGGRVLGAGEPKYLNSPETPLFSKGRELYGLFEARSAIRGAGCVLVCEGYLDVVALAQHGFAHAVATLGTACTPEQVRLLFRFSDAVVFAFDGDAAGQRAARKALQAALPWVGDMRSLKFLFLPPEHDPDSFVRSHGAEALAQALQQATPLSRFLLDSAAEGCALDTHEGRARMARQAEPLWLALPDGALKRQLLLELAEGVGLEARDLEQIWRRSTAGERAHAQRSASLSAQAQAQPLTQTAQRAAAAQRLPGNPAPVPPTGLRPRRRNPRGVLGRADRVARIVLSNPKAWDWLSAADQHLLAQQAAPYDALFTWLEGQWLEHGAQPWAALREALRGHSFEALALDLQAGAVVLEQPAPLPPGSPDPVADPADPAELQRELRDLLRLLRIEQLKQQESECIALAPQDPSALERYRQAHELRLQLQQPGADE